MWQLGQRCSDTSTSVTAGATAPTEVAQNILFKFWLGAALPTSTQLTMSKQSKMENAYSFFMNISVFIDTATVGSNRQAVRTAAKSILDDLGDNRQVKQKNTLVMGHLTDHCALKQLHQPLVQT